MSDVKGTELGLGEHGGFIGCHDMHCVSGLEVVAVVVAYHVRPELVIVAFDWLIGDGHIRVLTKVGGNTFAKGENTILVVDSMTKWGTAAFRWAQGMDPTCKDPRQWFNVGQQSMLTCLDLLTSAEFRAHLIVITHVDLVEMPDGTTKGFASALGKALGPKLPVVFNNMVLAESKGTG
jgi:hypothetical protein